MNTSVHTTDTSADALEVQLDGLRRMTPQQRIAKMCSLSRRVKNMAFDAIRRRHPDLDEGGSPFAVYRAVLRQIVRRWKRERNC